MVTADLPSTTDFPGPLLPGVALALGVLTVAGLWRLRRLTEGTTLVAPWCWALAATFAMTWMAFQPNETAPSLGRYFAGILSLAPTLAIFGAKRPQNVAWQWVVLAFLALLALPAGNAWLYRPGSALQVDLAWQWLLLAVTLMGVANYLSTGRAIAAIMSGAAQFCWLGDQFPAWLRFDLPARELIGFACACAAVWLAAWPHRRSNRAPLDRMWLDFRDTFGLAWTMRVAEQFNSTATRSGWPLRLNWHGATYEPQDQSTAALPPATQQALENLLRRFVSREWIAARLK
jgi:hypothetical protein